MTDDVDVTGTPWAANPAAETVSELDRRLADRGADAADDRTPDTSRAPDDDADALEAIANRLVAEQVIATNRSIRQRSLQEFLR